MRRGNLYPIMAPDTRPADPELRHNMLGMTEAGSVVLISGDVGDQPEHRRGSYGRPAPGFEAKIVDPETGATVQTGAVGELCIRGPYVMQRYHGREPRGVLRRRRLVSQRRSRPHRHRRPVLLRRSGGVDDQDRRCQRLPCRGGEGADDAHRLPGFRSGPGDSERGQIVAALVATDEPDAFDEALVRAALGSVLSAYKIPRRFGRCGLHGIPAVERQGRPLRTGATVRCLIRRPWTR